MQTIGQDLEPELAACQRQLTAIEHEADRVLDGLTVQQLEWRERDDTWSVADCLNHLVVTGNESLPRIRVAMADARSRGLLKRGPFRHGLLGNWLVRAMDLPPRIKVRAPKAYRPAANAPVSDIRDGFVRLQRELIDAVTEADGLDLARITVTNPVSHWFTLSLGQEFAFTAAHERRHLWQAARVRDRVVRD